MEKSENYYLRQEYMKDLQIPTFTQIKNVLGSDLGNAVIEECPEVLKEELGTEPKLHGAGDTLWTSPSDLLQGLVVLKPPFSNRYIKALTHKGILSIGLEIENKFRNEMEQKCKHALDDQEEMLVFIAEQERIKVVRDALAERVNYYEEKFESFENDFEKRLQEELDLLTIRMLEDNDRVLQTQKEQLEYEWQDRLLVEIEETTRHLTLMFLADLNNQEAELSRKYSVELKKLEAKHEATLDVERTICKETLKQLKHNLECKNISNLIYVLCMERRKCEQNRIETEKQQNEVVDELSRQAEISEVAIKKLNDALKNEQEKIVIRERCLKEILKQFKKFVYFALKAAPKQGEFLLNIEKLLLYELAETVSNLGKKPTGTPVFIPKCSLPVEKKLTPQGLSLPADHNCLDELEPLEDPSEELFSVIFNNKLYVREDFRNMVSQGIEIRPSNELWNKDVEELLKILKTSLEDSTSKKSRRYSPPHLAIFAGNSIATNSILQTNSIMVKQETNGLSINTDNVDFFLADDQVSSRPDRESRRSSVYFVETKDPLAYLKIRDTDGDLHQITSIQQQLLTEMLESQQVDPDNIADVAQMDTHTSILLCAKDSIEHHRVSIRTGSLRDDLDRKAVAVIKQKALNEYAQQKYRADHLENSTDEFQTGPVLENIRKLHDEGQQCLKDVELKKSIEKMLSNTLMNDGTLEPMDIMKNKEAMKENMKQQVAMTPRERRYSGLSMAQDSLEMVKSKNVIKGEDIKQHFINALDQMPTTALLQNLTVSQSPSKTEKISIMETAVEIDLPQTPDIQEIPSTHSPVTEEKPAIFSSLPKVSHTGSIIANPDQTWSVNQHHYKIASNEDNFDKNSKHNSKNPVLRDNYIKKENVGRIAGSEERIKIGTTAFTVDRVHSLLGIFREDPSLMRIFTACSR